MIQYNAYGDYGNWINNDWLETKSGNRISVISPYFDKQIATIPD